MALIWNRVTRYSQIVAIVLFVAVFALGYYLGEQKGLASSADRRDAAPLVDGTPVIADATYACDAGKTIHAIYHADSVQLLLSDGRNLVVPHAISGSGARYANDDESFVFWNKGTTAFITEGAGDTGTTTFDGCNQQ